MRLTQTNLFTDLRLGEASQVPKTIQILRVGKFNHPQYGFFEITTQTLHEMKFNFDNKVRGIDMSFDYYHESNEDASAWVRALELREDDTELWAEVDWTPKATQKLADRELRYFSPDFAFTWNDPESGHTFSNVLFGGGLTNRPFVKEMMAIVADENNTRGSQMTELEKANKELSEVKAQNLKLSEDKSAMEKQMLAMPQVSEVDALKQKIAELQQQLNAAMEKEGALLAEKKKADDEKMLAEKKTAFNVLLTEGKACAAQEAAFIKGDMNEFIKLAQPVNTNGSGTTQSQGDGDKISKILKLAEEKRAANPKLSQGDAVSLAKKEIEKAN